MSCKGKGENRKHIMDACWLDEEGNAHDASYWCNDQPGELRTIITDRRTGKVLDCTSYKFKEKRRKEKEKKSDEGCFITTAICESMNKPDDCYELNLLREFRDSYLLSTPEGQELVSKYYRIAPSIVYQIDKSMDANEIYSHVYSGYLKHVIEYIEIKEYHKAIRVYKEMVNHLEAAFKISIS